MSVYTVLSKECQSEKLKNAITDWDVKTPLVTPRSSPTKIGENIFENYIDIIHSKSNISTDAKPTDNCERPFDFFDDEEFAFGINLLNNNVACVGDNITKLIQMAQEPWPDNVKLFQPYEVEQILLPDNASCLAVQAFLKMCNLPFEVEMRWNAEFMSPSGRVPFIKCGAFVVSELEPIVQFAANKGVSLCSRLSSEEKAEMRAYMSLITNVLVNAELYISWVDAETFSAVTRVRNSSVYPWPLGWLQTRAKRAAVGKRLKALHWHDKTLEQVLADVEQCCNSLSQRLGDRDYFFGSPTPLDALVYGHTRALLGATGPRAAVIIKHLTGTILRHALRISNLTQMNLTAQEQYLLSQAFCMAGRRSPERERSPRSRRRLCVRSIPLEHPAFDSKAKLSQKIPNLTANESEVPYEYKTSETGTMEYVKDLLHEIVEKREEIADTKESSDSIDFEIIALPQANDVKRYLDRIDEHEVNTTVSIENDIVNAEDSEMTNHDVFDDGPSRVNIVCGRVQSDSMDGDEDFGSGTSCDANTGVTKDSAACGSSTGLPSINNSECYTLITNTSNGSTLDSKSTLKPSNEAISIEDLLRCLREKPPESVYSVLVDVD